MCFPQDLSLEGSPSGSFMYPVQDTIRPILFNNVINHNLTPPTESQEVKFSNNI